jgi:HEAT repeat protein
MGILPDGPPTHSPLSKDLSPAAQAAAGWLRTLARALKTARLYRVENEIVQQAREQAALVLEDGLRRFGLWKLGFTSSEIRFEDEVVVRPAPRAPGADHSIIAPEENLPFMFYRDGIRGLTLQPEMPRREMDALFDALRIAGTVALANDDLVTLLWQANLTSVQIDAVPLEQTIYLSTQRSRPRSDPGSRALTYNWAPAGAEIRAEIGQVAGSQGLHRDTFDDWPLPEVIAHTPQAYRALLPVMEALRAGTLAAWDEERETDWTEQAPVVLRQVLAFEPSEETRRCVSTATATWVASSIQRAAWEEAARALDLLQEFDPDRSRSGPGLEAALKKLDNQQIAEQLDEAEPEVQARFAALMVAIGPPAVDLTCAVLSTCTRTRARAVASTALTYLCGDDPTLLAPYMNDAHWYVVRNVVFVLGQIGGSKVVDLLRVAAQHPEPRVRRQVVMALGGVSRAERTPVLMSQLTTRDPQLLAATLGMLIREKNPRVVRAIFDRVAAPEFEDLPEVIQRALLNALGDVAEDDMVPDLERLLKRGGWFSRPSLVRVGAARTLGRIGTEKAVAVLEAGLRSKHEAMRAACLEGLASRSDR